MIATTLPCVCAQRAVPMNYVRFSYKDRQMSTNVCLKKHMNRRIATHDRHSLANSNFENYSMEDILCDLRQQTPLKQSGMTSLKHHLRYVFVQCHGQRGRPRESSCDSSAWFIGHSLLWAYTQSSLQVQLRPRFTVLSSTSAPVCVRCDTRSGPQKYCLIIWYRFDDMETGKTL